MSALSINLINFSLIFFIRKVTINERHISETDQNVSMAFKLTACRFVNSSLLLVILNKGDAKTWFDGGGDLAYEATILISLMALNTPLLYVINPGALIKKLKIYM